MEDLDEHFPVFVFHYFIIYLERLTGLQLFYYRKYFFAVLKKCLVAHLLHEWPEIFVIVHPKV